MRYFEYARQHQYLCSTTWRFLTCDGPTFSGSVSCVPRQLFPGCIGNGKKSIFVGFRCKPQQLSEEITNTNNRLNTCVYRKKKPTKGFRCHSWFIRAFCGNGGYFQFPIGNQQIVKVKKCICCDCKMQWPFLLEWKNWNKYWKDSEHLDRMNYILLTNITIF